MGKIKRTNSFTDRQGYTLIEVMTVSGIMALLALTLISIFLATIRGGTKAQVVQQVHQNGDFALRTMARMVRVSDEVSSCGTSATLLNVDGETTLFSLEEDEGIDRIASNSSQFLTGLAAEASDLDFTCYDGDIGNQIVTIRFTLTAGGEDGSQVQEKLTQDFATSVSTRQY